MKKKRVEAVVSISGGADSVFLLRGLLGTGDPGIALLHVNHGFRGKESEEDERFVKKIGRMYGIKTVVRRQGKKYAESKGNGRGQGTKNGPEKGYPSSLEEKARKFRYSVIREQLGRLGARAAVTGHTADDQVETVLMRVFRGAGVAGLKGIPEVADGPIERPNLSVWREEILKDLNQKGVPFREDSSNRDTRFERNWIRHVVIPLLEERYGRSLKKRIHSLGEKFREVDRFLNEEADRWIMRNLRRAEDDEECMVFRRGTLSGLPSLLRKRILQTICLRFLGFSPKERLLTAMDRMVVAGEPSQRLDLADGWALVLRYGVAEFRRAEKGKARESEGFSAIGVIRPGTYKVPGFGSLILGGREVIRPRDAKILCRGEQAAAYDRTLLRFPLKVRPLVHGDRIVPFGARSGKRVKEILIERKIPREERWGRPVVCDARGEILWIPGVVRSAHAPVTRETERTVLLRLLPPGKVPSEPSGKGSVREALSPRAARDRPSRPAVSSEKRAPSPASKRGRAAGRKGG